MGRLLVEFGTRYTKTSCLLLSIYRYKHEKIRTVCKRNVALNFVNIYSTVQFTSYTCTYLRVYVLCTRIYDISNVLV